MKLQAYLTKNKMTALAFAKKAGVSFSCVYKWLQGAHRPSLHSILTVQKVTKGAVSLKDWE